jgi:hypothetical protein
MTSAAFLLAILVHEAPVIDQRPKLHDAWEKEMAMAVDLDAKIGGSAMLVSPEVDTAILDAMRWYEARLASHPKDGDCHFVPVGKTRIWQTVCTAFGPLQVQVTALKAIRGTEEGHKAGVPDDMAPEALHDPEFGVRAGYAGILRWKSLCGGTPARWITAWGWGKCPKGAHTYDREAVRRCELTVILLHSRGQGIGWKCGHEGRKIADEHDQRLLKWAREKAEGENGDP